MLVQIDMLTILLNGKWQFSSGFVGQRGQEVWKEDPGSSQSLSDHSVQRTGRTYFPVTLFKRLELML